MKRFNLLLALSLASIASGAYSEAYAQGGVSYQSTQALPKVEWPKMNPKIQILNAGPEITDCRTPPPAQQFLHVKVPPMAVPPVQNVYAELPGGGTPGGMNGAPGAGGSQPGTISINLSRPAPARFDSNIPAGGPSKPFGLAPGNTTNLLAGKNLSGSMFAPAQPTNQIIRRTVPSGQSAGNPIVMTQPSYQSSSGAANASSGRSTQSVSGKMYPPRGSLLGKSNQK